MEWGGPPDTGALLVVEAQNAQELHEAIEEAVAYGEAREEAVARAQQHPPLAKLLRRYPTLADAQEAEERLFQAALRDLRMAALERSLEETKDKAERRRIGREIDELRRGV